MFNHADEVQIGNKGIDIQTIRKQIRHFETGFPYISLIRPATVGDGILRFEETDIELFIHLFEEELPGLRTVKFVPASGAASRMFKHLFEFAGEYTPGEEGERLFLKDREFNSIHYLLTHLELIAFYKDLCEVVAGTGLSVKSLMGSKDYGTLCRYILDEPGLGYASLPKALLKFHNYGDSSRTAAEEHLVVFRY